MNADWKRRRRHARVGRPRSLVRQAPPQQISHANRASRAESEGHLIKYAEGCRVDGRRCLRRRREERCAKPDCFECVPLGTGRCDASQTEDEHYLEVGEDGSAEAAPATARPAQYEKDQLKHHTED